MRRQSCYGAELLPCLDYQNFYYGAKMKTDKGKTWADIPVVPRAREAKSYPRGAPQQSLTMVGSGDTPCTARGGAGLGGRRLSQEALEGVSPPKPPPSPQRMSLGFRGFQAWPTKGHWTCQIG